MTPPLTSLLLFAGWTVLLVLAVGAVRGLKVFSGQAQPADFTAGVPHGSDRYWRLNRAHSNCLEFLPLFAVVVLVGAVAGVENEWVDKMARLIVVARVGQSLTHIASGSNLAINVRFGFFALQIVALVSMGIVVAGHQ